jgi:predicted CXXCH cytochrome family protein
MSIGRKILILVALLLVTQPAHALIKRSQKQECTICHVRWLETFSTDQMTLLGPTQTNIVIAGSVGLSSSRRICISCHDGYVRDSRTVIVAGNRHHQLKKVPDWLHLPDSFRLDINNEIYCGTCHGFHDVRGMGEIGSQPFMRLENSRSEMCKACHTDKGMQFGTRNHPLGVKSQRIPREKIKRLGGKFGPDGEIICQSCHLPHGNPPLLAPLKGSAICLLCHPDKKTVLASDHNMTQTAPALKNMQGKKVAETGPCSSCHVPHNGNGLRLWARKIGPGNPATLSCLSCHNKATGIKGVGDHTHPVGKKVKTGVELPLFAPDGRPAKNGTVQCASCHNVHAWSPDGTTPYVAPMEGDAASSFLRKNNQTSALCLTCHKDKSGVVRTDHDLRVTAPDTANVQGTTPAASGPCSACHVPHNGTGNRLWARQLSGGQDGITQLCTGCHRENGVASRKAVGKNSHPVDVPLGKLAPGKDTVIDLPLSTAADAPAAGGKVVCTTCHDPHTWSPAATPVPQEAVAVNREGDAASSYLRKDNSSGALCKTCHPTKALVVGTPHDLSRTAPNEKNLWGQTVKESGPCGACHLVHNSPNELKLWARPYGPVEKHENQMIALCTSCHAKGRVAANKVQEIANHPEGTLTSNEQGFIRVVYDSTVLEEPCTTRGGGTSPTQRYTPILINNIVGFSRGGSYTPIFNDQGEEVHTGKISCPSCHDAHVWNRYQKEGTANGKQTKGAGRKFLRTESTHLVCVECHGPDALFRYQYFHAPISRAQYRK